MMSLNTTMPQEDSAVTLPLFFDKNPELKARVVKMLAAIPAAEKQGHLDAFKKFVSGELTWAEVKHVPRRLLKELAKVAYFKFQKGDFKGAEILFKGLAIIDHTNWYYRVALGAIFQKQGCLNQAIEEYGVALTLKEDEVVSLVNRGECHLKSGDLDAALEDFTAVGRLPLPEGNPWKRRATLLSQKILTETTKD
jgi:tetratricopeptide (TPR) repeat protein